ncbi:hypothetical protein ARMGADRAFT_1040834 [Armillaria gallica]|uniref:Uncharacterized protein n=1 Tax=Armillaria gallica TaxID=47427 RepID=A0A2H3CLX7_ARMGA|nr:hypothetical protein ARMGADRAFT_1040829 [Armillaria gallica]PBK79398.1 hypothetical protein ARMGADRAFT_1040834 [Armillaria gallica]
MADLINWLHCHTTSSLLWLNPASTGSGGESEQEGSNKAHKHSGGIESNFSKKEKVCNSGREGWKNHNIMVEVMGTALQAVSAKTTLQVPLASLDQPFNVEKGCYLVWELCLYEVLLKMTPTFDSSIRIQYSSYSQKSPSSYPQCLDLAVVTLLLQFSKTDVKH